MRNLTIYLAGFLCIFASKMMGQDQKGPKDFEGKAHVIAQKIEKARTDETAQLKVDVDAVNKAVGDGKMTAEQGEAKKTELAKTHAENLRVRTEGFEDELQELVQQTVDGKVTTADTIHKVKLSIDFPKDKGKKDANQSESRTTSQFVFAFGLNNVVTNGSVANSDFRYWGSHSYEWGIAFSTRLAKSSNLLRARYGVSLMYNNLRPTEHRIFVDNGSETNLEASPVNLSDSRFRNVNLVFPVHLEFDFSGTTTSKDGKTIYKTHQGFRMGFGGYAGFNVKSKQILKYDLEGYDTKDVTKGSFNTNDFIYGVSTYIGYKDLSLYCKYDLSPIFKDNAIAQRNVSLGLRWDLN